MNTAPKLLVLLCLFAVGCAPKPGPVQIVSGTIEHITLLDGSDVPHALFVRTTTGDLLHFGATDVDRQIWRQFHEGEAVRVKFHKVGEHEQLLSLERAK